MTYAAAHHIFWLNVLYYLSCLSEMTLLVQEEHRETSDTNSKMSYVASTAVT